MATIYTIAHPFTNDIVYVGCSNSLANRARLHLSTKSTSEISKWIQALKNQFLLPKIEEIEICDSDEAMYLEGYWIQQLQSWGFNLLNKNKILSNKRIYPLYVIEKEKSIKQPKKDRVAYLSGTYIKKTPEQWASEREERQLKRAAEKAERLSRKINKWNTSSFEIGKTYEVPLNKKVSFRELLRQYAVRFGLKRHFTFVTNGETIIFTVCDGERIYMPNYGRTKSGSIRYTPLSTKPKKVYPPRQPKFKYGFDRVNIGDVVEVYIQKWDSFKNSLRQYNIGHNLNIQYSCRPNEDLTKVIVTYIDPKSKPVNVVIPSRLVRAKSWGKMSHTPKNKISKEKAIEMTMRYINGEKAKDLIKECPELKNVYSLYQVFTRIKRQSA